MILGVLDTVLVNVIVFVPVEMVADVPEIDPAVLQKHLALTAICARGKRNVRYIAVRPDAAAPEHHQCYQALSLRGCFTALERGTQPGPAGPFFGENRPLACFPGPQNPISGTPSPLPLVPAGIQGLPARSR